MFRVHQTYLKASTKDYHIYIIEGKGRKCVLIKRWGKTGTSGTTQAMEMFSYESAIKYANKIIESKLKKGYDAIHHHHKYEYANVPDVLRSHEVISKAHDGVKTMGLVRGILKGDGKSVSSDLSSEATDADIAHLFGKDKAVPKPKPKVELPSHYGTW